MALFERLTSRPPVDDVDATPEPEFQVATDDRLIDGEWQSITAAVGPLRVNRGGSTGMSVRRRHTQKAEYGEPWQRSLIEFDRDGPGFVGYAIDLQADLGAMVRLTVEYYNRETGDYTEATTEAAAQMLRRLRGPFQTREEIFKTLLRGLGHIGEMAFLPVDWKVADPKTGVERHEVRYLAVMPTTVEAGKERDPNNKDLPLNYIVKLKPDATPNDAGYYYELPRNRYFRIWEPDAEFLALPHSDWRRTIADIRRFRTAQRAIFRAASSQLINAGLLRFEGDASDVGEVPGNGNRRGGGGSGGRVRLGYLGSVIESLANASKLHLEDVHEEKVSAAMPHMIVTQKAVEKIDLGRLVDPGMIEAKQDALEDVARAAPLPRSVIVDGLGASERNLNNYLQDETLKQTAVIPLVRRGCAGLTLAFMQPLMRAKSNNFTPETLAPDVEGLTIEDFRIGYDDSPLTVEQDESDSVAKGVELGSLAPRAYAKAIGWEDYVLEPGTPDWEVWQAVNGSKQEPTPDSPQQPLRAVASPEGGNWFDPLL